MQRSVCAAAMFGALLWAAAEAPAAAQNAAQQPNAAQPQQRQLWTVRCIAQARTAAPDCAVEQRAVVTETGRLFVLFTVRVPAGTRKPVMMIQAPLGPFLPAGVTLNVDGGSEVKLDYQTCDANGCYAGSPVSEALLQSLFSGQKLKVTIQAFNKQPVQVPLDLTGFTAAYRSIQ